MLSSPLVSLFTQHPTIHQAWAQSEYEQLISLSQQALRIEPDNHLLIWYLGLAYLLQGDAVEAQGTWMMPLMEGSETQIAQWTQELCTILEIEAHAQEQSGNRESSRIIWQQLSEIDQTNGNALFHLLRLSLKDQQIASEFLAQFTDRLCQGGMTAVDPSLLQTCLIGLLQQHGMVWETLEFAEACLPYITETDTIAQQLTQIAVNLAATQDWLDPSVKLLQLAIALAPNNFEAWSHLSNCYDRAKLFNESLDAARQCCEVAPDLPTKIHATVLLLRGLLGKGGNWQEAIAVAADNQRLLEQLIADPTSVTNQEATSCICNAVFHHPYLQDDAAGNRQIQNQLAQICQTATASYSQDLVQQFQTRSIDPVSVGSRRLKIGYLSHAFREHSVGWLARWLLKYHDREQFETYGYFVAYQHRQQDDLRNWYETQFEQVRRLDLNAQKIAAQIAQDEIDILIDLDSITLDISFEVLAMKPAPIQVTWLGLDATGLQTVDYFIADPYVLPDQAEQYYQEKIVRLPHTYLAVDGFEVGIPTLTRQSLNIAEDAVIYLSSQSGCKRHLETACAQLQILKQVPNSYFLIKGFADALSVQTFFNELADQVGVSRDRLRFLPNTPSEAIHRANLRIADVVLDTFPYNGATTTMETLWMEIPLVTQVGQQFAARNSYTMLKNSGIEEGIAWNVDEYIAWGVRYGLEAELRQQVAWKLRQSKQTAPLWNTQQFTREMEAAYLQLVRNYRK